MSFNDIFKKSFLEGFASKDITIVFVIVSMAITLAISMYIFFVYRLITRKTFYSKNFNISLVGVALITASIIITIQSSIVVSLGMVGALSIVRFRTAIKDPIDLMFLFWAISIGIICGAGFAVFAIVLSIALTAAILILNRLPLARSPMILVINSTDVSVEDKVISLLKDKASHYTVKSRNMTATSLDLTIEIRITNGNDLVQSILKIEGITSASLLSHDGEVTF